MTRARVSPPVAVAIALPVLLAVVVAGFGVYARITTGPDTGPLALPPAPAPQASDPRCDAVLAALPDALPADPAPLPPRTIDPAVPGARAWVADPEPVVLRCGTARPAELDPTSPLIVVNGVDWLARSTPPGAPSAVYAAVDRGVYLELSAPAGAGPGPLQVVSDVITAQLPPQPVRVR